jgi:ubiquinone/menaquinone biosynthesis C-methylase UbiE
MARARHHVRLSVLVVVFGLAAFYAGTRLVSTRREPGLHPLTGRQIAGTATDQRWLDRSTREQEEAPDRALALIGIRSGMIVADIGAGTGYMTVRLARLVGPSGRVYANDIQPAMLRTVQDKAKAEHLANIEVVAGTETDAHLPEDSLDLALLVDVYHELRHPREMLRSLRRSLKPDGRLVLVEYRQEDPEIPIAPTHRMSVDVARAEVEAEGFTFERAIESLPRQHILVFHR